MVKVKTVIGPLVPSHLAQESSSALSEVVTALNNKALSVKALFLLMMRPEVMVLSMEGFSRNSVLILFAFCFTPIVKLVPNNNFKNVHLTAHLCASS